jgi:hypothetical protein
MMEGVDADVNNSQEDATDNDEVSQMEFYACFWSSRSPAGNIAYMFMRALPI